MRLKELWQLEQDLIQRARTLESLCTDYFDDLRALMADRGNVLAQLEECQEDFNRELKKEERRILDDIKAGKLALVDTATGEPATVAVFNAR